MEAENMEHDQLGSLLGRWKFRQGHKTGHFTGTFERESLGPDITWPWMMRGSNWHLWKTMTFRLSLFAECSYWQSRCWIAFWHALPVAPLLQCYLHHQRLSIADVIIIFCRRRHRGGASAPSWSVGKGKLPLLISRINFKYKLELCARHLEDEYRGEPQSEDMKSLIHCRGRLEGGLSGCQGCAGGCQTTVVEHEMAIKEVWELLLEVRGWPRGDRKPLLDPFEFCLLTQWNPKKETEDVWNLLFSLDKKWILLQKTLVWMWKISSFWFSEKIKVLIQAPVIYTRPQGFVHLNKKRGEEEGQRMPAAKALVILVSVAILLRWTVSKDGRVGCVPGRRSVTQP